MEKKAALPVDFSCKKIAESLQTRMTDKKEVEKLLRHLCLESGGWLSLCQVGRVEYFKTEKIDINVVCKKLQRKLQIEEENGN